MEKKLKSKNSQMRRTVERITFKSVLCSIEDLKFSKYKLFNCGFAGREMVV